MVGQGFARFGEQRQFFRLGFALLLQLGVQALVCQLGVGMLLLQLAVIVAQLLPFGFAAVPVLQLLLRGSKLAVQVLLLCGEAACMLLLLL